jgi:hypothetical protein
VQKVLKFTLADLCCLFHQSNQVSKQAVREKGVTRYESLELFLNGGQVQKHPDHECA